MDTKFLSWFLQGGSVAIPKRFLAYMAPLGLSFEELGEIVYLFSLEGKVRHGDAYGKSAAKQLVDKRLIRYDVDAGEVDFSPLFDKMFDNTMAADEAAAAGDARKEDRVEALVAVVKRYEKERGIILSSKVRGDLSEVLLRYGWNSDLTFAIYDYFYTHQRQHYNFLSFAQMAHNAGVEDLASLKAFVGSLDYELTKVREVLRLLGKRNSPTEPQRALYAKWSKTWHFSHEVILMAIDDTTGADNPSMNYLDAILAEWHAKGIHTPQEVRAHRAAEKSKRSQSKTTRRPIKRYISGEGERDFSSREE
ncbi:MAG: DnaD domain protein [Peptococcaceae bacterium]|nr:DnaD domain protein [Peptococcaceae bacterium]